MHVYVLDLSCFKKREEHPTEISTVVLLIKNMSSVGQQPHHLQPNQLKA